MSLSLPEEAKRKLCEELKFWSEKEKKEKVKHWYRMGGWVSWGLNIYPLLRPALNNFYPKLKGRRDSTSQIWINNSIHNDFQWALRLIKNSSGICLLKLMLALVAWDFGIQKPIKALYPQHLQMFPLN